MSPRWPSLATSSRRMTSMVGPPYPLGAVPGGEGQQGDVACPLDGHLQLPLVRGADALDAPRQNLAPVAHELPDRHVLVVNVVDLLHAELADAAPAEKAPAAGAAGPAAARAAPVIGAPAAGPAGPAGARAAPVIVAPAALARAARRGGSLGAAGFASGRGRGCGIVGHGLLPFRIKMRRRPEPARPAGGLRRRWGRRPGPGGGGGRGGGRACGGASPPACGSGGR